MSAEQQFRTSLRSFNSQGAARGTGQPQSGTGTFFSNLSSGASNVFGNVRSTVSSYVPIGGSSEEQEPSWFQLSAFERLIACGVCILAGAICFMMAFFYIPLLALFPAKFASTFTIGSLMMLLSVFFLKGPVSHLKHMISRERLAFSLSYIGSMVLTLWAAFSHMYVLTIIFSILQIIALIWYFVSYFPGGINTLRYGTIYLGQSARSYLPI